MTGSQQSQPQNPLQLGQTLYEVLDVTVIGTPRSAPAARYNRVIYNADGGSPVEPLDLQAQDQIRDVKAATNMHAAVQNVYVLTADKIQIIGSEHGKATSRTWPVSNLTNIVDLDPQQIQDPHLLLFGQDAQSIFLQSLDCSTGHLSSPLCLPTTVKGSVVGALLARNQLDAHAIVCTVYNGQLTVNDLGSSVLGANPAMSSVNTISLGVVQNSAVVDITTASLAAGTSDQQVVVTYLDPKGVLNVTVLGWTKQTLVSVATATPDLSFAPPEGSVFRVAAGDLLGNGVDQLVVGYSATYQSVKGCAALLLFELEEGAHGTQSLKQLSKYAAANTGSQPLASIDLHLAVGLFGEALPPDQTAVSADAPAGVLGVLVVGGGATFDQLMKGEASILAGLVPVDAVGKTFPGLNNSPGLPQHLTDVMTIDYQSGFFALPSDVTGRSVILGPPTLSQSVGKGQLLAVIQAPPFESGDVSSSNPTLTFGQSVSKVTGCNVSSNKVWTFSQDTGRSIGISGQTLGQHVSNSYGYGFDQLDDYSTSRLVQSTTTISVDDLIVLYAMSYYVWTYPVYRKAGQDAPDGTMAVIFPMTPEPVQSSIPASDPSLGYIPRSQNGVLLSYVNLQPDGYDESQLLFNLTNMSVTNEPGGSTLNYDQTQMVSENISKSFMVHNSTTDSAHFSISTTLLDYIPIDFGLDLSEGQTYSESDVQTTMLSHTTTMNITVTSGSVKDIGYEYQIAPYIYYHQTMGCLMVSYKVAMPGKLWARYYGPRVMLQSLYPNSTDPVLQGFSRSISFQDNNDGTVGVKVEVFNNSLKEIQNVACEFYHGAPSVVDSKLTPSGNMVGRQSLETLLPTGRATMSMNMSLQQKDQVVVVVVYGVPAPDGTQVREVYWGIYPPSAFADWHAQQVSLPAREG
ncbi:hypothetical protein ACNPQM_36775 [Streptomyces sp. NPDC056231]|uniref:hypothetical protein n=1 Tax=Streptomyces sp. NPDC056231 TaxID=3345755 RepID=UPI003AB0ACAC